MPRILPRLLKRLAQQPLSEIVYSGTYPEKRPAISSYRPVPIYIPVNSQSTSRSVLLERNNPITQRRRLAPHKRPLPQLRVSKTKARTHDHPREMTIEERQWWSSPYLRMLSSTIRACALTKRHLPSDFLIRLGIMRLPTPLVKETFARGMLSLLVPDGLEHPKYKSRRAGKAKYIVCWRYALRCVNDAEQKLYPRGVTHAQLEDHVGHLLRVRVLQELELLAESMESQHCLRRSYRGKTPHSTYLPRPVLKRLTRAEFQSIRATGIIPYENALAVLVVPPVNCDPETKRRTEPSMSSLPIKETPFDRKRPELPKSTLHPSSLSQPTVASPPLAEEEIPLYNCASLFPLKAQRAALHDLLKRITVVEKLQRPKAWKRGHTKGDQKASSAFLLFGDGMTVLRADSIPLAIAFFRLRMYEGVDYEEERKDGWLLRQKYRSIDRFE